MSDNKRTGRGMFGKGYYIALILCAAAIGITGYFYYQNAEGNETQLQNPTEGTRPVIQAERDVPAIATEPQVQSPVIPGTEATAPQQKRVLKTTAPVAGEEVFGYSMEVLSYNETTRDWRTHNGIDLAAEAGTDVVAAADGEVYTVYEDPTLGYTVVIRHEGGYTTRYSSLAENLNVKPGDQVAMGEAIGTVDATALVETVLGPHLHFSVTYQDLPMDPAEFFALGA